MQIITANRLSDGVVVFLSAAGFVTRIAEASVLTVADAVEAGMTMAQNAARAQEIIDVNLIDVSLDANSQPVPVRLRERIRAFGPTVPFGEAVRERLAA